jgi:hypothetical protein
MEIYVLIDNQPQGPYTPELIRKYLATGQLQPTDLGAYAGRADWKPLSTFVASWGTAPASKAARPGPSAGSPTKSTNRSALWIIAGVSLVLVVAGGGFWLWNSLGKSHSSTVSTAADPSWPNSFAELNTWYAEPPEGQNAAVFFANGFADLRITDADQKSTDLPVVGKGKLPEPGTPLSPQMKASIASFVRANQSAWAEFQKGAKFEQARYPIDLNLGPQTLLPHLTKIKSAAQLAQLQAILSADNNQSQAAADSLLVSLAIAQSLKNEPVLISQLVRVACYAIEAASLQQVMNSVTLSPADLEQLSTALSKAEASEAAGEGFTRSFVGERASQLSLFNLPPDKLREQLQQSMQSSGGDAVEEPSVMMRNLKSQKAFAEETLNHGLELRKQPLPDRLKFGDYFTARAAEAKSDRYYLCQLLLPALGTAAKREAMGLANLRLMQAAVALEQFRQANGGTYPDSLSALVPKYLPSVPTDPIQGGDLHYQKNGGGYELQSTGREPGKPLSFKIVRPPV